MGHLDKDRLEAGLGHILESPSDQGSLKLIVRRPDVDQREVLESGDLNITVGLIGDNWSSRNSPHPDERGATETYIAIIE